MMHLIKMAAAATVLTVGVTGGVAMGPSARASKDELALNGKYRATSIGNWAKTNETYHDEPTVISTWTMTSTCTTAQDCTGTVTSDQGWSAPMSLTDGVLWHVTRDVPDWEKCPDGTSYPGHQTYIFYPVDANGQTRVGSPTLAGTDRTLGPSGACGRNQWLAIEMPLRLDRIA
jgi:hypothetical protein